MQNELPARPLLWRGVPVEYGENEVKSARVKPVRSRWGGVSGGSEEKTREFSNEAVKKLIYLAVQNITRKWTKPIQSWKAALSQFAILLESRVPLYL
jgi:hypothetical protein